MKKLMFSLLIAGITLTLSAQSSIDKLFDKYAGKEGFTTITINGNLLKMIADLDDEENDEVMKHADKFSSIRILAQDDEAEITENFYDMVIDEINKGGYEELMTVNSSDSDVKILIKAEGKKFKEFLLVAGGDDNAIIQIKGDMSYDDVKEIGNAMSEDHKINFL